MRERFWERYGLTELQADEWEALCDGCAKCCLIKLIDDEQAAAPSVAVIPRAMPGDTPETDAPDMSGSGASAQEIHYTNVACRALDLQSCRCRHYQRRLERVPDCVRLDRGFTAWRLMPASCAYRKLDEGKPLAPWHPLLSGTVSTVHAAGASIRGKVLSEENVHPDAIEEHIVRWVDLDH